MENRIPSFLLSPESKEPPVKGTRKIRFPFLDRTLHRASESLKTLYLQAESANNNRLICRLHPITKVLAFLWLIVLVSLLSSVRLQGVMALFIFAGYLFSGVQLLKVYKKTLVLAFLFGFVVMLPAALNVITPGESLFTLLSFRKESTFWIYHIPEQITVTKQGSLIVALLTARVFNSVSLALLLVHTTSFPRLLKAFRVLWVPRTLLMVVWLAYKFIFILCRTIGDTYQALRSRLTGPVRNQKIREIIAGRVFFIYGKAQRNYEQIYAAMVSRGYSGQIIQMEEHGLKRRDYVTLGVVAVFGTLLILLML